MNLMAATNSESGLAAEHHYSLNTPRRPEGATVIDSQTQTQAITLIGEWLGNTLGDTARRVFAEAAPGPHEPTKLLTLSYTGDYGWSYPDWIANSGIVAKMAEIGLTIEPADGAIDAVLLAAIEA
jgi:hypothetical protein